MPKKKYTYIDLFAGCGGLSDGFEQTQMYRGLAHVEWERIAADTLKQRLIQLMQTAQLLNLDTE